MKPFFNRESIVFLRGFLFAALFFSVFWYILLDNERSSVQASFYTCVYYEQNPIRTVFNGYYCSLVNDSNPCLFADQQVYRGEFIVLERDVKEIMIKSANKSVFKQELLYYINRTNEVANDIIEIHTDLI